MRKIVLALIMCVNYTLTFSQINIDDFYQDKNQYLIYSITKEFDSIPQTELKNKIKNWAGSYNNGVVVPSTPARTYNFINYFDKDGFSKKMYTEGLQNLKTSTLYTINSIIKNITINKIDTDW